VREVYEREAYRSSDEHEGSERGVNRKGEGDMKEKDIDLVMEGSERGGDRYSDTGTERRVNRYNEGGVWNEREGYRYREVWSERGGDRGDGGS